MADLDEKNSSGSSKIVGATTAGIESNFANVSANQDLQTADISNNGGVQGTLSVGTSAVEAKVGGSALANRKSLTIYNDSSSVLYWGYDNTVTTSTGTPVQKKQFFTFSVGPSTAVYLIAGSAANNARITENA